MGFIAPLFVNVLGGVAKVIPMTVFATPIAFSISVICFTLAIFKFDFLKVAPIALQKVVDRISDSYVVVNENNKVGDVNGDGSVSVMDATMIQKHLANLTTISEDRLECADTNKDGVVSVMDATQIQRYLAQLITEF